MATIANKGAKMYNPAHPGEILRELYLAPLGITVTRAAKALGVTRKHVSTIVNGRTPVTPTWHCVWLRPSRLSPSWGEHAGAVRPMGGKQEGAVEDQGSGDEEGGMTFG